MDTQLMNMVAAVDMAMLMCS